MICKRCKQNETEEGYVNCDECRKKNREAYAKRKASRVTDAVILSFGIMEMLNTIIISDKKINEAFQNKTISRNSIKENCPICLNDIDVNDHIYDLQCHHKFHTHCLMLSASTSNKCPICRDEILPKNNLVDLFVDCDDTFHRLMRMADTQ